ncbi:MAG TPA: hypothetical protein VGT24_11830 [Candidatus Acidoferrales bacterium]|nr:hypothetical protein [Candidatus Acidoferrales bacterium]
MRVNLKRPPLSILIVFLLGFLGGFAPRAQADAVVLLEEPYSYDGAFAGTGHTSVYLTRICAESPLTLRRCNPGESGVVISRYNRIGGYDWIAIPLVPYLYAVEKAEDIPLYADAKLAAFLRDQYRRAYLEDIAPDGPAGEMPKGDWVQLVGSSYDRTNYGFQIETTPDQDDALIAWLNSHPNHASYKVVTRNCADFVGDILNFYYPHSESRGSIADLGMSTPKHEAKSLVSYSRHHRDLKFSTFVIPQVPGAMRRSKPVRGVLESIFRAKKYAAALALFHPFLAGAVVSVNLVADRFNPAKNAPVFNLTGDPTAPPSKAEKQSYLKNLESAAVNGMEIETGRDALAWRKFETKAQPGLDAEGEPILQAHYNTGMVELGVTRSDLSGGGAPVELQRGLMISRLKQTLARSRAPRISSSDLRDDWELLERIDYARQANALTPRDSTNLSEKRAAGLNSN